MAMIQDTNLRNYEDALYNEESNDNRNHSKNDSSNDLAASYRCSPSCSSLSGTGSSMDKTHSNSSLTPPTNADEVKHIKAPPVSQLDVPHESGQRNSIFRSANSIGEAVSHTSLVNKKAASALLQADAPAVSGKGSWMKQANIMLLNRMAWFSEEDRQRLQDEIDQCRKALIDMYVLNKPHEDGHFLKTKLQKLGRSRSNRSIRQKTKPIDVSCFKPHYWTHQKTELRQPILVLSDERLDLPAVKMFNSLLQYSQMEINKESVEPYQILQNILKKCSKNGEFCDEFFMQIIKQTTESSDWDESAKTANWMALALACCTVYPNHEVVLRYLRAHLKKYALDNTQDEGKYASFCQRCLARTLEKRTRKFPLSIQEMRYLSSRHLPHIDIHLMDGEQCTVEFHPQSTIEDILRIARLKVNMMMDAVGWSIIETVGQRERCANHSDFLGDVLFRWEIYSYTYPNESSLKLVLKKRVFITPFYSPQDEMEVKLLAHQCISYVFEARIPLTEQRAVHMCAIRSVAEDGDIAASMRIMPRDWRERVHPESISRCALSYQGLSEHELHLKFIELCQEWSLFGATFYEVMQFNLNWPEKTMLVIHESGIYLNTLEVKFETLIFIQFKHIISFYTESRTVLIIVYKNTKKDKLILKTRQTAQVVYLIRDYMIQMNLLSEDCRNDSQKSSRVSRSQLRSCKSIESSSSGRSVVSAGMNCVYKCSNISDSSPQVAESMDRTIGQSAKTSPLARANSAKGSSRFSEAKVHRSKSEPRSKSHSKELSDGDLNRKDSLNDIIDYPDECDLISPTLSMVNTSLHVSDYDRNDCNSTLPSDSKSQLQSELSSSALCTPYKMDVHAATSRGKFFGNSPEPKLGEVIQSNESGDSLSPTADNCDHADDSTLHPDSRHKNTPQLGDTFLNDVGRLETTL